MEWLIKRFQTEPEHVAFIHEGRKVRYGCVVASIDHFLKRVLDTGIQRGDTVVLLGDYSPEVFCMMMALFRNGSIVIPLTRNSVVEESEALAVSGCEWYVDFNVVGNECTIAHRGLKNNNALLKKFRQRSKAGIILFSSGSTGKPKGILHDFSQIVDKFRNKRGAVIAIPFLMIDHFGGINTILAITASLGTAVTVSDRSIANICKAIEEYKVELLPTTPSFLRLMIASKLQNKYDLSSLKRITYGTEVMPQSTLDSLHLQFPNVVLQQTYGLSEVGVLHSKSQENNSLWVRLGGEGFQTKVVDGILWIKSQYSMVGYLNAPSEFDEDGWFNTQDKVEIDGEYLKILGRVTDIINVGGQKVYPAEVENIILNIKNIKDVVVFGEHHNLIGQIVVAKIQLKYTESLQSIKIKIRRECLSKLLPYKVPSKIIITKNNLLTVRQKKIRSS